MRTIYSIKNSITQFINNIIAFIILFISQSIFIKILGIEYNGLNGIFNNILTILNLFELGISSSITYILYKYIKNNDEETIKSIMFFYKKAYKFISAFIFIMGLLVTPFLKYIIKQITIDINIYIVYIIFLINTVSTYFIAYKRNLLYASQRKYIINIINIIFTIILNIVQITIIYITKNYYLYLIIKIICIVLENIVISLKVNKEYPYILEKNIKPLNKKIKDNIINRVKALIIHRTAGSISNAIDNILISIYFGITISGIFTNYNYIITTIKTFFSNIILSAGASIGNLLIENNKEKNYQTFKKISFLNYWITVFTSTCLLLLTEPFITLWIGREYLLDRLVLIILVINYFQLMLRTSYSVFKDAAGIWIEDKYLPIIQCSSNLILSIIFINIIGISGVFIGTILSSNIVWFYSYPKYVYKKLFNKTNKEYLSFITKRLLIFTVIESISYIINIYSKNIITSFIITIIVPNFILFIIYKKTYEFNYYKKLLIKMVKKCKKKIYME